MSDAAKIINLSNERRLTFVAFADVEEHPRKDWLVRDFLGAGEMSAIYGMPGTAKSALAGDLGAHVSVRSALKPKGFEDADGHCLPIENRTDADPDGHADARKARDLVE